jgi:signal transduction histidine kinase
MKRPWQVWLIFVLCVAGAAAAMAWLTRQALDADRLRRVAEAEAELEQRVSLALWRMDTELAPLVAQEVIRAPSDYRQPLPLRETKPPYVLLHFEASFDGRCYSPQEPTKATLDEFAADINVPKLLTELPDTPLPSIRLANAEPTAMPEAAPTEPAPFNDDDDLFGAGEKFFEGNRAFKAAASKEEAEQQPEWGSKESYAAGKGGKASKAADFEQRGERYQSAARQSLINTQQQQRNMAANPPTNNEANRTDDLVRPPAEQVGVSRPLWIGERLLLARRVGFNGETFVQGCWLDWPEIKRRLLTEAAGLLPDADLMPVHDQSAADLGRMLAGLPVRLVVGESPVASVVGPTLSVALWMGWGAVLLAAAAAAALLHGVMTLSERRAAFVSSVTHELRTPLTTFRMYAEMLARGMVPDARQRQEYFQTLQREAERLTLLVENVLAYARLERGRKPFAQDRTTVVEMLKRVRMRLEQRAMQAEMECAVELNKKTAAMELTTDLAVVEQILFNLVDNAAKYARHATDRRIHVEANHNGRYVTLVVRDHGPGIEHIGKARRMQAFGKSAQESAETAPGVGLGLALCGRLARQLGGRLDVAAAPGGGAMATLLLPAT